MNTSTILETVKLTGSNVIFCNYWDTVMHKRVHPNYAIRLWSKYLIRELGLALKIDELYYIRKESESHLSKTLSKLKIEIPYHLVIQEVYNRLVCTNNLNGVSLQSFADFFELADYRAETKMGYLNSDTVQALNILKNEGFKIYGISDFYTSSEFSKKVMAFFDIEHIFNDVFISSDFEASKHTGDLYPKVLNRLKIKPEDVLMIGGNLKCDIEIPNTMGMQTLHIAKKNSSKSNYKSGLGSDKRDYLKITNGLYKQCNLKNSPPNSDYILFYTVYIERLYKHAIQFGIKNILFLSREGLYLKKMFDYYQDTISLKKETKINSHYFRCSRQAAMLVSLKELDKEAFSFLRKKYPDLSLTNFLKNLDLSGAAISTIESELGVDNAKEKTIEEFMDSKLFNSLVGNAYFRKVYEEKRQEQKTAFTAYLNSFSIDFYAEGMHLADIGWGGSMQEMLFRYFEGKVTVYGHYLGIREVYDIKQQTKRFGLNFSVYPYPEFSDNILKGNIELCEQLLSAPHGSVISYDTSSNTYTNEFHHAEEKRIFETYIQGIQDFMFESFKDITEKLEHICYDDEIVQSAMTDYALRIGLYASKKNIEGAIKISKGFYTNVGDFTNGLPIGSNLKKMDLRSALKTTLLAPDKMFGFILRIKPLLLMRNVYFLAYFILPLIMYNYIRLNCWFRFNVLSKRAYLKYSYLK